MVVRCKSIVRIHFEKGEFSLWNRKQRQLQLRLLMLRQWRALSQQSQRTFTAGWNGRGFAGGINLYAYVGNNPVNFIDPYGLYPGQMPPALPGYDPATWHSGQWNNGRWFVESPDGRIYTSHPEDEGHWRHWDGPDDKWPPNSNKPEKNRKKKLKPSQCETDPSGDAPEWTPPTNNPFMPFMPFNPIGVPEWVPLRIPFRIPIPVW